MRSGIPDDFDGIIAGAPAANWSALNGMFQTWLGRVNIDANGHQILTAEKLPALHAAVLRACADATRRDPRPARLHVPTPVDPVRDRRGQPPPA